MNDVFLVGSSQSLLKYVHHLKPLNKKITMAYGHGFMYFVKHLGYYPDYWLWLDPHSSLEGLKHVAKLKHNIKTKLIVFDSFTAKSYSDFQDFVGTTKVMIKKTPWKKYIQLFNSALPKFSKTENIDATTIKFLRNKKKIKTKPFSIDGKKRFGHKQLILGMEGIKSENQNKLTYICLPVCYHLGFKNVNIIGFDGIGGRWFDKSNKRGIKSFVPTYLYLKKWIEWKPITKMNIFYIANKKDSLLRDFIPNKPISQSGNEVIEISKEQEYISNFWKKGGNKKKEKNLGSPYYVRYEVTAIKRRERFTEYIASLSPKKVLEVGCAAGTNLVFLHKLDKNIELHGLDINKGATTYGKSKYPYIQYYNKDIFNIDKIFQKDYFDVVFTMGFLIHIHKDCIAEISKKLLSLTSKNIVCAESVSNQKCSMKHGSLEWSHNYKEIFKKHSVNIIKEPLQKMKQSHRTLRLIHISKGGKT